MNKHLETTDLLQAALAYAEKALPIIPLNGKIPIRGWQEFVANRANVLFHFSPERRANIGLRTGESGYLVIDTDNDEAENWVLTHCEETPMQAVTGSGSKHRYYANPPRKEIRNRQGLHRIHGLDVRGHGGFIVLPPSVHPETGEPYRWTGEFLQPEGLPRFSPAWVYQRVRRQVRTLVLDGHAQSANFLEYRASRWLEKVASESPAVSHEGGHDATFRVACKLTHSPEWGFGLDRETAIKLITAIYNPRCQPPWDLRAIEHKVDDAIRKRR